MSTFCARCLSPHRKTPFFTICGCESPQYGTSQHRNTSKVYRGQWLNRSTFRTSHLSESHRFFHQYVSNSSAVRQKMGLKERIPRPHQSLNLTVPTAYFSTWLKTRSDNILYRFESISSFIPSQLKFSNTFDQSKKPKSGQKHPLLLPIVAKPAEEKRPTKEKDAQQKSQTTMLSANHEQHSLEKAVSETNQGIASYHQSMAPPLPFSTDDQGQKLSPLDEKEKADNSIQTEVSVEEKNVQQLTTPTKGNANWSMSRMLQLPFSLQPAQEEKVPKEIVIENTSLKNSLLDMKDSKHKVIAIEKPSTEDVEKNLKEHSAKEATDIPIHNSLSYEYVLKPSEHLMDSAQYKTKKNSLVWNVFRNLLFSLWTKVGFQSKTTSPLMLPFFKSTPEKQSIDETNVKQASDFKHKDERKTTPQSLSMYYPLKARRSPTSKDQLEPKQLAEEEEEVGWNVFRKLASPFGDNSAQQKRIQRQKGFVPQTAIEAKTRVLVSDLQTATSYSEKLDQAKTLCEHIKQFPSCRHEATESKAVPLLLRLQQSAGQELREETLEALALLGYCPPVKGRGIRILCLDGGGTRALVSIMCLQQLEKLSNRKIYELFDYVCGVSTGALLATIVFLYRIPLEECERLYHNFSRQMFSRSRVMGTGGLVWNYAFYDSDQWEQILQKELGHKPMIGFARDPDVPKVAAVSTVINTPRMKNFVFRNYNFPPSVHSQYPGSCTNELWEVIRASSAAPGYYEDFCLGNYVHSDGGLLANNPTALAIHESHLLWPGETLQCLVSLGTGRFEPILDLGSATKVSLKDKVTKMVDNATDTEAIHLMMADVMPPDTYFRFNPYLSEDLPLDEIRQDRLEAMKRDTTMYLRKNDLKMRQAVSTLKLSRLPHQHMMDWLKLKADTLR